VGSRQLRAKLASQPAAVQVTPSSTLRYKSHHHELRVIKHKNLRRLIHGTYDPNIAKPIITSGPAQQRASINHHDPELICPEHACYRFTYNDYELRA
jgi:hypothetical protein